jgi:Cu/Ag efflux protein CusF
MRKSLLSVAIATTVLATSAYAASILSDTGSIKTLDSTKHQVTLADGKVFTAPTGWAFANYKAGDKVRVTYDMMDGKRVATQIARTS